MADDIAVTKLVFDASGAKQGADDFRASAQKIIADNQAVAQAEAKRAQAIADAAAKDTAARKAVAAAANDASNVQTAIATQLEARDAQGPRTTTANAAQTSSP